jgi:serine/threonine-protein kinase HipA
VLKAQILFWLIGATDQHAKNFSVFLGPGGSYRLTPLYDVLSAQPSLDTRQIERKQMKLAMAVGATNHYRIEGIQRRHFIETGKAAGLSKSAVESVIEEIIAAAEGVMMRLADELPPRFPKPIHASVSKAIVARLRTLSVGV